MRRLATVVLLLALAGCAGAPVGVCRIVKKVRLPERVTILFMGDRMQPLRTRHPEAFYLVLGGKDKDGNAAQARVRVSPASYDGAAVGDLVQKGPEKSVRDATFGAERWGSRASQPIAEGVK